MARSPAVPPAPDAGDAPVGVVEIAMLTGVAQSTVHYWRPKMPEPQASTVAGGPWWWWSDVRAWAVDAGKLPADGRPSIPADRLARLRRNPTTTTAGGTP